MTDHTAEEITGRVKQAVGDITGDKDLQREGKKDQREAAIKTNIDKAADKLKELVDPKE